MNWIDQCKEWKEKCPLYKLEEHPPTSHDEASIYSVFDAINRYSQIHDIIVTDAGSSYYLGGSNLKQKYGQRFITSLAQADMGWALPASIGLALENVRKSNVIAIIGDGSFMSNLQELATVHYHNLPIKFIVIDNVGYLSIRNTQSKYFNGNVYGVDYKSGLWFPDLENVAKAFEIEYHDFSFSELYMIETYLKNNTDPMIIRCICKEDEEIFPAQAMKDGVQQPLDNMFPFIK